MPVAVRTATGGAVNPAVKGAVKDAVREGEGAVKFLRISCYERFETVPDFRSLYSFEKISFEKIC